MEVHKYIEDISGYVAILRSHSYFEADGREIKTPRCNYEYEIIFKLPLSTRNVEDISCYIMTFSAIKRIYYSLLFYSSVIVYYKL